MGRAKKNRKERARNRRARRTETMRRRVDKAVAEARSRLEDARVRREARAQIEASDLPDGVKKGLSVLVDPIGTLRDRIIEEARKAGLSDIYTEEE